MVKGDGGIDQFKNTIYKDLSSKIHLLNGVTTLTISGNTTAGQDMPIRLESNPSTGHIWDVSIIDPLYVQVLKESKFERKGNKFGSPMVQVVSLKGVSNGSTTMQLTYHRPWEKGLPVSNKVNLQIGSGLSNIDLSVPVSSAASQALTSPLPNPETPPQAEAATVILPASFNWGTQGKLTPIKDQGYCGSCWAFSTVGAMESAIRIKSGVIVDLSEQYLVRCNNEGWNCEYGGGFAHTYHVNKFIAPQTQSGAVLESTYPYTATDGTCSRAFSHPYKLTSWYYVVGGNDWSVPSVNSIKQAIYTYGPVSVGVCAGNRFSNYTSGIFATDEKAVCGGYTNHAVVLTGWDNTTSSWVLRNSWGTYWGERGYMRIRWNISRVGEGANYVVYPAPPAAPRLIAPSGTIKITNRPKYQWGAVAGATQYYLVVANATKTLIAQYIPVTNCVSGVCSYLPAVSLVNGSYRFNVRTKKGTVLGNYNPAWKTFIISR